MTIQLSPQLETALASEAARRGVTVEALATELLASQLPAVGECTGEATRPENSEQPHRKTMLDRWKAHLDSLPKPAPDAPRTNYSQDTGLKFAEALADKRKQGRS